MAEETNKNDAADDRDSLHETLANLRDDALSASTRLMVFGDAFYMMSSLLDGGAYPDNTPRLVKNTLEAILATGDLSETTIETVAAAYYDSWKKLNSVAMEAVAACELICEEISINKVEKELKKESV